MTLIDWPFYWDLYCLLFIVYRLSFIAKFRICCSRMANTCIGNTHRPQQNVIPTTSWQTGVLRITSLTQGLMSSYNPQRCIATNNIISTVGFVNFGNVDNMTFITNRHVMDTSNMNHKFDDGHISVINSLLVWISAVPTTAKDKLETTEWTLYIAMETAGDYATKSLIKGW